MRLNSLRKSHLLEGIVVCIALLALLLFSYHDIFRLFYQQDEWATLGVIRSGGVQAYIGQYTWTQMLTGSGRLFSIIFHYPFYMLMPFQVLPFAFMAMVLHFLNSVLVYLFVYRLTKKYFYALLSAIFFVACSVSSQAVTWFASTTTTLPSATFLLLSFLLAIRRTEKGKAGNFIWSQVFAIVAFMFKESGAIAFVLSPYLYFFWGRKRIPVVHMLRQSVLIIVYGVFIAVVHVYRMILAPIVPNSSFIENSSYAWQKLLIHVFQYPLVSLSQVFIPSKIMFSLAKWFQTVNYSHLEKFTSSQLGVESIVSDFVSFAFSVTLIAVSVWLASRSKYRNILLFGLSFTLISFLPFIVLEKQTAYLESRYFYNGAIGGGILFAGIILSVWDLLKQRRRMWAYVFGAVLVLAVAGYLWKHVQYTGRELNFLVIESSERIRFFSQLNRMLPQLPPRSVIYVTGNNFGYYGTQQLKVPLQQGPGYTFMVWYWKSGVIPVEFIRDYFLWRLESEGYATWRDQAFGYFYDLSVLGQYVREGKIAPSQVIGLYYDTDAKKLTDITPEIRNNLRLLFL